MEWIGNIENKVKAIHQLHDALDTEGEHGFIMRFRTNPSAMHSEGAVADQLEHVAGLLREGFTSGLLMDANGNSIGSWDVTIPDEDAPPANLACPHCKGRDRLEFDGERWFCAVCDGTTDGADEYVSATAVEVD